MSERSDLSNSSVYAPISSVAELLAAAAGEGLRLSTSAADFDDTGLDFRVVEAVDRDGTTWIVRTPRRADVVAAARVEARALQLVRPRLPVAVPDWRIHSDAVIAYPRLAGAPAVTMTTAGPRWQVVDPAAPCETFLADYAAALAALQAVPVAEVAAAGVPVRSRDLVRARVRGDLEVTRDALAPTPAVWRRWQRWLTDHARWPGHVALVHGDLHPGHLLLADDGHLVGVLDWTEAHVGDPATDLALFFGCFGAAALADVIDRFAAAGGRVWPGLAEHAAERWAAFPALCAAWALRHGNAGMLEHARAMLATVES
ncbi:MAG TPA: phosphotransferase [Nannocystis sp.]|jgi:aminoglycoside phosphotransferase (APT) family kinase protein